MLAATGATRNYGRFLGIWEEFQQLRAADPSFDPAHPVVPLFTRQPFDVAAPQTVISDPLTARVAEMLALGYEVPPRGSRSRCPT